MKKYRLKEEVKKYFHNIGLMPKTLAQWKDLSVSIEALEEVESKIHVNFASIRGDNYWISKSNNFSWTEQEREDIEHFLNVFGSWEKMIDLVHNYSDWYESADIKMNINLSFKSWLKEKGYDK